MSIAKQEICTCASVAVTRTNDIFLPTSIGQSQSTSSKKIVSLAKEILEVQTMLQNTHFGKTPLRFQTGKRINTDESSYLEETVKILQEQIVSLKLELHHQRDEIQEIKQELWYKNQESAAIYELCIAISSKLLTVDQAKELANSFLCNVSRSTGLPGL